MFANCGLLKIVGKEDDGYKNVLPSALTTIGNGAFLNCTSLEEIVIPSNVTYIGTGAFNGCSSLARVTINANNITSMGMNGYDVFKGSAIKTVELGNDVTSLPSGTFKNINSLTNLICGPVFNVNDSTTFQNTSLAKVFVKGTEAESNIYIDCPSPYFFYYYSEEEPNTSGRFWHYVEGEVTIW